VDLSPNAPWRLLRISCIGGPALRIGTTARHFSPRCGGQEQTTASRHGKHRKSRERTPLSRKYLMKEIAVFNTEIDEANDHRHSGRRARRTVATAAMSGAMLARQVTGKMGRLPPKLITDAAIDAAGGEDIPERTVNLLAVFVHFAFGAAAGSAYGLIRERMPVCDGIAGGVAFGTVVWLVSYGGWVPALGILPPPPKDRPGRPFSMLLSHWIYGSVLSALLRRNDRRRQGPSKIGRELLECGRS
jgi:hypothetical protein